MGWLQSWLARPVKRRRMHDLTREGREEILRRSPLEAVVFQGEGFHVFRKGVADMNEAYVTSLGEISCEAAEDWIIARWLEEEDARAKKNETGVRPV